MGFLLCIHRKIVLGWQNRRILFLNPHVAYHTLSSSELESASPVSEGCHDNAERDPEATSIPGLEERFMSSEKWLVDHSSRWEWIMRLACAFMTALRPSFWPGADKSTSSRKLHPTAWLDGLRGVASLMVLFHHASVLWYYPLNRGWGSSPNDYHFVQLPFIRLFYSGPAMVAIFFVVSGFSLSYKALSLIRKGRYLKVLDALCSSVLRRGFRLVIPPATITFGSMLATYWGWYGVRNPRQPPQSPYIWEHLKSWWFSAIWLSDPFRPQGIYSPTYDTNLWTIPVELYHSMVIFITLLGLSKVRGPYRLLILSAIVCYASYYAYCYLFLFLSGVLLAELHHIREDRITTQQTSLPDSTHQAQPTSSPFAAERKRNMVVQGFWVVNFLLSLFLASIPMSNLGGDASPGYITLTSLIPTNYRRAMVPDTFWLYLAATYLVLVLDNAPFLQAIFTTRIAQYLGRISFALYICHGTILYTLGWNLSASCLDWSGREPGLHYNTGIAMTVSVLFPVLFFTADLVAMHVDAKSVIFAKWLSVKISVAE